MPWGATERIIRKIDATDPVDLTLAEIECRKMVMNAVDRLRADVPQFRNAHLCDIATQLGITESRRLVGEYVLRREDMDQPLDDAIGITGSLDPLRRALLDSLPLPLGARARQPARRRPLHLCRPPHSSRHQGDPRLHGDRPGGRHRRGARRAGRRRAQAARCGERCRTPCAEPARSCSEVPVAMAHARHAAA